MIGIVLFAQFFQDLKEGTSFSVRIAASVSLVKQGPMDLDADRVTATHGNNRAAQSANCESSIMTALTKRAARFRFEENVD